MIKKTGLILVLLFALTQAQSWGIIGHRTVGKIAEAHLSKKAAKKINKILNNQSLAEVSTWMDDVKSDSLYDYVFTWHWATIPDGKTYEEADEQEGGDIIKAINSIIEKLKKGGLSNKEEEENLKMLVHLVGDIHQPLHIGNGEDMGGNKVRLKWFWDNSNLHRVWDTDMIDSQRYSYTELAEALNNPTKEQVAQWQNSTVLDWAYESMSYREQVYTLPEDNNLTFEYRYKNWPVVKLRILQAGVRLAGVLNEIYG